MQIPEEAPRGASFFSVSIATSQPHRRLEIGRILGRAGRFHAVVAICRGEAADEPIN